MQSHRIRYNLVEPLISNPAAWRYNLIYHRVAGYRCVWVERAVRWWLICRLSSASSSTSRGWTVSDKTITLGKCNILSGSLDLAIDEPRIGERSPLRHSLGGGALSENWDVLGNYHSFLDMAILTRHLICLAALSLGMLPRNTRYLDADVYFGRLEDMILVPW